MIAFLLLMLLVGVLMTPACTHTTANGSGTLLFTDDSARELAGTVLFNTLQCGSDIRNATAIWINNPQQLWQRYQQLSQQARDQLMPPQVDFNRDNVLLITMGQRPTGGYLLNYQEQPVFYDGKTLEVQVSWQEPLPGYKQADVLTAPCLLIKLPTLAIRNIRILDQDNAVKLEVTL